MRGIASSGYGINCDDTRLDNDAASLTTRGAPQMQIVVCGDIAGTIFGVSVERNPGDECDASSGASPPARLRVPGGIAV